MQVINSFIFTGDFEDPYKEFFVKKKFRRGVTKDSGSSDFIFKMTSKPHLKIPIFLMDSASTIFKAGSSLHLLEKQGLKQSTTEEYNKSLKEYYEICSQSFGNSNLTFQRSFTMRAIQANSFDSTQQILEFQITKLKQT